MATAPNDNGNFVSEWFGQRIYPEVRLDLEQITGTNASRCPFLSDITRERRNCVKNDNSHGVCTISSISNGPRQDWLVCPFRVISSDIVRKGCRLIFGLDRDVLPIPVSILDRAGELDSFKACVQAEGTGYVFFQSKLGGEISIVGTALSPELSFDVTLVEIRPTPDGSFAVTRYGILEIQTMDYHGTYKSAVTNLRDALRLHRTDFAVALRANLNWASERVEGPNIANVFKRTFYQMMLKFKLSGEGPAAAGTMLALPKAVWDSWQPFLGAPELEDEAAGTKRFVLVSGGTDEPPLNAYICVFDIDASAPQSISPIRIEFMVRVSPERLAHHAFNVVPDNILHAIQTQDSVLSRIKSRLSEWWPDFQANPPARRGRKAPRAPAADT
jgi:hypothetical protein